MASPELPSATLGSSSLEATQDAQRHHPAPAATSRGFHRHWSPLPPNGRTHKIGFLHLPRNVRTRIYQLAIFDHDRGAVFLPRSLPRRVQPHVDDMDIGFLEDIDVSDGPNLELVSCRPLPCQPGDDDTLDSAASGRWVGVEDLGQATFASVISLGFTLGDLDFMTDHEIMASLDAADEADAEDDNTSTRDTSPSIPDSDLMSEISDILRGSKRGYQLYSSSIPEDDGDNERVPETEEEDQDESNERRSGSETSSDEDDSGCDCGDAECRVCCELPIHHDDDQWQSSSSNSKNVFTNYEHGEGEDVEHADTHERIGMVYEQFEPSILLACKEIREECLSVYYSRNSFSWRFSWTDYLRSCLRFKYWAKAVSTHHISLITSITFQGRHVIEEGVEFSVDIDLLDEYPFFETRSYAEEDADIANAIHREMASYLWLMVQTTRRRPTLSVGHLLELASIFVQGMHRDAGGCLMTDEASACRRILSPLF